MQSEFAPNICGKSFLVESLLRPLSLSSTSNYVSTQATDDQVSRETHSVWTRLVLPGAVGNRSVPVTCSWIIGNVSAPLAVALEFTM